MKKYCGIGSRETPQDVLDQMVIIANTLAKSGWMLRSGSASGADTAFETGHLMGSEGKLETMEIFLPWKGFNNSKSDLYTPTHEAKIMASTLHGGWNRLTQGAKLLHARNCHQVLGLDLKSPVDVVICWTKGGKEVGGTATAIKLAKREKIPVINLYGLDFSAVTRF